jgi:hypothetical protein
MRCKAYDLGMRVFFENQKGIDFSVFNNGMGLEAIKLDQGFLFGHLDR